VTAAYWRFLWQRLQNTAPDDAPPLYAWPASGQVNFSVDARDIESRIVVTTAWGLDHATVNATTVRVLGPDDQPVAARVSRYGNEGNTVMLRTERDLAYDTAYRVELSGALRTLAGRTLRRALTIPFRTRCAPESLGQCPPLATPRPTIAEPPARDAGVVQPDVVMVGDAGSIPTVMTPSRSGADGGCGCRAGQNTPRSLVPWLLMTGACVIARRARRCATAVRD
jgi:hypothetical protein